MSLSDGIPQESQEMPVCESEVMNKTVRSPSQLLTQIPRQYVAENKVSNTSRIVHTLEQGSPISARECKQLPQRKKDAI